MAAEGDKGIFRHQFAIKLASYPLRVVFPEETGLSFSIAWRDVRKGGRGNCAASVRRAIFSFPFPVIKGKMPIVHLLAISFTGKMVALFKGDAMNRWLPLVMLLSPAVMAADCFDMAGQAYRIDPDLLRATAFRESSFNPRALNVVSDKKYAVGLMQIHSQHFAKLAQFGITPMGLYNDPCLNIYTGAYYMAHAIKRMGYNWDAVGAYYAGFSTSAKQAEKRKWYAERVKLTYDEIKKGPKHQGPNNSKGSKPD